MKVTSVAVLLCVGVYGLLIARAQDVPSAVNAQLPGLLSTYKNLHEDPESSHQEQQTSVFLATALRQAGYSVTEHVGKYGDGTQAYGVVSVLENGGGPTVLVRTDMDALPVEEKTGLPYASHARARNETSDDVGVMHACGHDLHITTLLGEARMLAQMKDRWHGRYARRSQGGDVGSQVSRGLALTDNGRPVLSIGV